MRAAIVLLLLLTVPGAWVWHMWIQPAMRMRDEAFWASATREQKLAVCRRALSSPIGPHHDAALEVGRLGDRRAVPHLIDALRWVDDVTCTKDQVLGSLRQLTGVDAGSTRAGWLRWSHRSSLESGRLSQAKGNPSPAG